MFGTANLNLTASVGSFLRNLRRANTEMSFTVRNMGRTGEASEVFKTATENVHVFAGGLRVLSALFLGLNLAILGLGAGASRAFMGWEREMVKTKTVSGALASDMEELKRLSFDIAKSHGQSPTAVAGGMSFMGMAGMNPDEIKGTIGAVATIAKVGMLDIATSADLTTNIMKGFNLEVSESAHVADVLTGALTSSNTNMRQLGDALKYVAPAAHAVNIGIAETSAAIGMLGNAGIQGEMAGAGLRTSLSRLAAPSKQMQGIMKKYNVVINESTLKTNGLVGVLQQMEKSQMSFGAISKLVGTRAGPHFAALLQEGSQALEIRTQWLNDTNKAQLLLAGITSSLTHKLDVANAVMETLAITAGERFTRAFGIASEMLLEYVGWSQTAEEAVRQLANDGINLLIDAWLEALGILPDMLIGLGHLVDALRLVINTGKLLINAWKVIIGLIGWGAAEFVIAGASIAKTFNELMMSSTMATRAFKEVQGDTKEVARLTKIIEMQSAAVSNNKEQIDAAIDSGVKFKAMYQDASKEIQKPWSVEEMLKYSTAAEKTAKKLEEAKKGLIAFRKKVNEKDMTDEQRKKADELEKRIAAMNKALQDKLAEVEAPWEGTNIKDLNNLNGTVQKHVNIYAELAKVYAKANNNWGTAYQALAELQDITEQVNKGEMPEWLANMRKKQVIMDQMAIVEEREIRNAEFAKDAMETYKQSQIRLGQDALKVEEAIASNLAYQIQLIRTKEDLQNKAMGAGLAFGGSAGISANLQKQLEELQQAEDMAGMTSGEKQNALLAQKNQLIIEQAAAVDSLADAFVNLGQTLPGTMLEYQRANEEFRKTPTDVNKTNAALAQQNVIFSAAQAGLSAGSTIIGAFAKDAKQAAVLQAALNAATAVFFLGMGLAAAGTGQLTAATGYLSGAVALGAKAGAGLVGAGKGKNLKAIPDSNEEEKSKNESDSVRRGVVDALKESGLYQPWEKLQIDTFGTTPVGFGGGNMPSARDVEYHNQMNRRRRG